MIGHGEKLTRKQEAAIAALLAESSIGAAARKARIGEATLQRWLRLPAFAQAYRDARQQLVRCSSTTAGGVGEAVDTVHRRGRIKGIRPRVAVAA